LVDYLSKADRNTICQWVGISLRVNRIFLSFYPATMPVENI
jgi:hypothetical protein